MKTCTGCKEEYPATSKFFYRNKNSKDGLERICKNCRRESDKKYKKKMKVEEKKYPSAGIFTAGMFQGSMAKALNKQELSKRQYRTGKTYEVETRNRGEIIRFTGKMIQETDDFITLQNKNGLRESFLKKDFYIDVRIKELTR